MRLTSDSSLLGGWLLADEGDEKDAYVAPTYAIAWDPKTGFDEGEYFFAAEKKGDYVEFPLRLKDGLLVLEEEGAYVRFAFHRARTPLDGFGVPFVQVLPYIGKRQDVLDYYGKAGFPAFLGLIPLDLMAMDRLYLKSRVILVGVTTSFGRHVKEKA